MIVTISDHFIEPEVNLNTVCLFQQTLNLYFYFKFYCY